jgi:diaminopimelate decarboxylase
MVLDAPKLDKFVTRFEDALADGWPNSILSYSFKTNALPWLLSYMRDRGVWAEVVSDTEYDLAIALGYTPDQIVFNGPIKSRDRLWSALVQGSIVNLDSKREVLWTAQLAKQLPETTLSVGLRVNWDVELYCPGESTAKAPDSRFGFNPASGELDAAIDTLTEAGVRIAGLHMHRNSNTQSVDVFRAAATVAKELITSRHLTLDWVDIGGGFFGSEDGEPTFADYVTAIREVLQDVVDPAETQLIVEPGGALIAVPIEFHASVIDVKQVNNQTFVLTDASRTNIDPLFRRKRPFPYELETDATETRPLQTIGGFTCMEDDRLMQLHDERALETGDRIIFYNVGAYTLSFQPQFFIEFPPAVYVRTREALIQVRKTSSVQDYLQGQRWIPAKNTANDATNGMGPWLAPLR